MAPSARIRKPRQTFIDLQGRELSLKSLNKFTRDAIIHLHGHSQDLVTQFDPENPLSGQFLTPGINSPICNKCNLDKAGAKNPFFQAGGSEDPLVTVVYENVSAKEDEMGQLAKDGVAGFIHKVIIEMAHELEFDTSQIRWLPMTRCASRVGKHPDYGTKGGWCRHFAIQDLMLHPPKVIIPVGSVVLGLLSHKSNAQDWGGKILTWRGWPDDWLTDPEYVLPRPSGRKLPLPAGSVEGAEAEDEMITGHPIFGPVPHSRSLMMPLQTPRIVYGTQNKKVIDRWRNHVKKALKLALDGAMAPNYFRPWYDISEDPEHIKDKLSYLIEHDGLFVSFDTETSGLQPWGWRMTKKELIKDKRQGIVFMMFRWVDVDGRPQSLGFPWNYEESPLLPYLNDIRPYIQAALANSTVIGHNLSFDARFILADLGSEAIDIVAPAMKFDTWHMAYTLRQQRGSLGLELLTYTHFPELAGYEEDFTLLIELFKDKMHPENGGHYAACPKKYWDTHLKSYVMGDVEATFGCWNSLKEKLAEAPTYSIPLAHTTQRGRFRWYKAPSRETIYREVISPASRVLIKMMARGMSIDVSELESQETILPKQIADIKAKLRESDPRILSWCQIQETNDPEWEFDLENKEVLKGLLFKVLDLPVKNLTEGGKKVFGQDVDINSLQADDRMKYAAVDKYTLNSLAAEHADLRPLLDYRRLFKAWSSYIRPMRNAFDEGLDKKPRTRHPHLMADGLVHGQFIIPGTRSGRLSCVDGSTKLSVRVNNLLRLVEIRDIDVTQHVSIITHLNRWKRVEKKFFKGYEEMYCICTKGGRSITATRRHGVLTPTGWVDVGDITIGSKLATSTFNSTVSPPLGDIGRRLETYSGQRDNHSGAPQVGVQSSVHTSNVEAPQVKVWSSDGTVNWISTVIEIAGESQRCSRNSSDNSSRLYGGHGQPRPKCKSYSREVQHFVACGQQKLEHGQLGNFSVGFEQNTHHNRVSVVHVRTVKPGLKVGVEQPWSRQGTVCYSAIQDFCKISFEPIFRSGSRTESFVWPLENRTQVARSLLVSELPRTEILSSSRGRRNSVSEAILSNQRPEGACGFCHKQIEYSSRDRRAVSSTEERCSEGQEVREVRLQSCEILTETGSGQHDELHSDYYQFDEVTSITPVGRREVWDIQVEEDHSYIAQGLIHHNSVEPNLQQLPTKSLVKRCYSSRWKNDGGGIVSYDLSQIELRLIAAACGDESMVKAYHDGIDLHSLSMSKIFKRPYEECTKEYDEWLQKEGKTDESKKAKNQRKISKTINFLTGYGGGANGLQGTLAADSVYYTLEECEEFLEKFFDSYPALRNYLSAYKHFIATNGVAVSILGRVRLFEEVYSDDVGLVNKALRAGCNHLIQATASDMMLVCLCVIEDLMRQENLESKLTSTVHDSLVIDFRRRSELDAINEIVMGVVQNMPLVMRDWFGPDFDLSWMIVPFDGDGEVGHNYYDLRTIPKTGRIDWDKLLDDKAH